MNKIILLGPPLLRVEYAIGAMVGKVVLVITEETPGAWAFACEVFFPLGYVACDTACAFAASRREDVKEDSHVLIRCSLEELSLLLRKRVLFDHSEQCELRVGGSARDRCRLFQVKRWSFPLFSIVGS